MSSGSVNTRVVTVFYGEEEYLLDRELTRALKWPGRLVLPLNGVAASEGDVISAMEETTLDGTRVVVAVDNAEKVKVGKDFAAYIERRDSKDKGSSLVAICRTSTLPKAWERVSEKARVVEHPKFKPWEEDKLKARLQNDASAVGVTLEADALALMLRIYKDDSSQMANEVKKLSFLVERGSKITMEMVRTTCPQRAVAFPWDVAEEAIHRRSRQALVHVALLFLDRGDEIAVPIVAAMMKQVERLLLLRSMVEQKKSPEAMGGVLGIHPYVVKKTLAVANGFTVARLRDQMQKLCELEVQVKGPAPSKRTLVELAVLSLAAC